MRSGATLISPVMTTKEGESMSNLMKPLEAAQRLPISERTLWAHTVPRGPIPAVRIGTAVRYDPEALTQFIEEQSEESSTSLPAI